MTIWQQQIVDEARSWIGTPYHHRASLRGVGVDCIGLLIGVCQTMQRIPPGWELPQYENFGEADKLLSTLQTYFPAVDIAEFAPGDILVFTVMGVPCHVGIAGGPNQVIHAAGWTRKVVEHHLRPSDRKNLYAAYRIPEESWPY